jgi:hypothetical protein
MREITRDCINAELADSSYLEDSENVDDMAYESDIQHSEDDLEEGESDEDEDDQDIEEHEDGDGEEEEEEEEEEEHLSF